MNTHEQDRTPDRPPAESRLSGWLRSEADRVGHGPSIAPAARRLAIRRRRRSRIGVAVAGVALIAAAGIPGGLAVMDLVERPDRSGQAAGDGPATKVGPKEDPDSAKGSNSTTGSKENPEPAGESGPVPWPKGPVETELNLGELGDGPTPKVPWFDQAAGVLHDGEQTISVDTGGGTLIDLEPVSGGYVAVLYHQESNRLVLIGDDGGQREMAAGVGVSLLDVSDDGERIVWADLEPAQGTDAGTDGMYPVTVYRLGGEKPWDGRAEVERELSARGDGVPAGFLGPEQILLRPWLVGEDHDLRAWNLTSGTIESWMKADYLDDLSTGGQLAAVQPVDEHDCVAVIGTDALDERWRECGKSSEPTFDPNAQVLAFRTMDGIRVLGAQSGAATLTIGDESGDGEPMAFEPDNGLLISVHDSKGRLGVVRCAPTGACELALPFVELDPTGDNTPYVVAEDVGLR